MAAPEPREVNMTVNFPDVLDITLILHMRDDSVKRIRLGEVFRANLTATSTLKDVPGELGPVPIYETKPRRFEILLGGFQITDLVRLRAEEAQKKGKNATNPAGDRRRNRGRSLVRTRAE